QSWRRKKARSYLAYSYKRFGNLLLRNQQPPPYDTWHGSGPEDGPTSWVKSRTARGAAVVVAEAALDGHACRVAAPLRPVAARDTSERVRQMGGASSAGVRADRAIPAGRQAAARSGGRNSHLEGNSVR